eukprot:TRINITY_DN24385_c0_g1_i2.p1 TRINITY_DN24385_c0_g1~~TRINITY_DN24385_c0_g1_i2.p1  ORF type:complete len:264 (+),score=63.12 TRINITY_DN24385_c0_g1_i2:371-1162(+)
MTTGGGGITNNSTVSSSPSEESSNNSSYIIVVNYLLLLCYGTLLYYAIKKKRTLLTVITVLVIAAQLALNVVFVFYILERIKTKVKAVIFSGKTPKTTGLIMTFAVAGTFQTTRLFFGSFMGIKLFNMINEYSVEIRQPLNLFSIIQSIAVHLPVVGFTIVELVRLSWGTRLYLTLVDASAISVLLLGLLVRDAVQDQANVILIKLKIIEFAKDIVLTRVNKLMKKDAKNSAVKTMQDNAGSISSKSLGSESCLLYTSDAADE